jgi:hypothetical protein
VGGAGMSSETLKELLKPPFVKIFDHVCNSKNETVFQMKKTFYEYEDYPIIGDRVTEFAVAAMNEKWDRDFCVPERWLYVVVSETDHGIICPRCRFEYPFPRQPTWSNYQYCPHCGEKLDKPEIKK